MLPEFTAVTRALRDPQRIKVLKLLQHGELCVCEIQAVLGISQATVSKHLSILSAVDLLERRQAGLWAYYRLCPSPATPYASSLLGSLRHWLEDDPQIRIIIEKLPEIHRQHLCNGPGCKPKRHKPYQMKAR
jgi:ArsR family transcriptional regulator